MPNFTLRMRQENSGRFSVFLPQIRDYRRKNAGITEKSRPKAVGCSGLLTEEIRTFSRYHVQTGGIQCRPAVWIFPMMNDESVTVISEQAMFLTGM